MFTGVPSQGCAQCLPSRSSWLSPHYCTRQRVDWWDQGGPGCCGGGRGGGKPLGKGDIRTGLKEEVRRHSRWRKEYQQRHRGEGPEPFLQGICPRTSSYNVWCHARPPGEGRDVFTLRAPGAGRGPDVWSPLCHTVVAWPWTSHVPSLSLGSLIGKPRLFLAASSSLWWLESRPPSEQSWVAQMMAGKPPDGVGNSHGSSPFLKPPIFIRIFAF